MGGVQAPLVSPKGRAVWSPRPAPRLYHNVSWASYVPNLRPKRLMPIPHHHCVLCMPTSPPKAHPHCATPPLQILGCLPLFLEIVSPRLLYQTMSTFKS